jgi:hypothetical protein
MWLYGLQSLFASPLEQLYLFASLYSLPLKWLYLSQSVYVWGWQYPLPHFPPLRLFPCYQACAWRLNSASELLSVFRLETLFRSRFQSASG